MDSLAVKTSVIKTFIENGVTEKTLINDVLSWAQTLAVKLFWAILIYFITKYIIKFITKSLNLLMTKRDVDESVRKFLVKTVKIILQLISFVIIIGVLGVDTTSLIALLASAGFAVGLALQGSLQNFAGGIIILFLKPFRVGDEIETSSDSHRGLVQDIGIFTTTLLTFDNITIFIPNSELSTKPLINYTKEEKRRIDEVICIDYGDSVDKAREILIEILSQDERVIKEDGISIIIASLSDSSVDLKALAWTHRDNYYGVKSALREKVHARFKEEGITIPFPQIQINK